MALTHGGQLQQVAKQYNIPVSQWLDVSTGIAPISYPIPTIPESAWQQLPQHNPELINAAKHYYQCTQLIITNGSQAVIKALPNLYKKQNVKAKHVYLPERGYKEHAHAWKVAGYQLHFYQDELPDSDSLPQGCVLVIINPNNPTGQLFKQKTIGHYHSKLTDLDGLLIVDEAFIDVITNTESYCSKVNDGHCLVLRSFGKFFGLAGIRIGFVILDDYWFSLLQNELGPWQVNGPAQVVAQQALENVKWQSKQKDRLNKLRTEQETLFNRVFDDNLSVTISGCDLFLTVSFESTNLQVKSKSTTECRKQTLAQSLYHLLCKQGVYCRLADEQDTLRFGVITAEMLPRLELTLSQAIKQLS